MKVKDLLSSSDKWCQGFEAKTIDGHPVSPHVDEAARWCIVGAISKCYGDDTPEYYAAREKFAEVIHDVQPISVWNDEPGRTFTEVRKKVLKAGI